MKDRIKELRKKSKLTQVEFGERIAVKGNTITCYEKGVRIPSDAIIKSICREFHVNEEWLRNGIGDMDPLPAESEMELTEDLIDNPDDEFNALILHLKKCYDSFDDAGKQVLREFARKFRQESESSQ